MLRPRLRPLVYLACASLSLSACAQFPEVRRSEEHDYVTKLGMAKLLQSQGQADAAAQLYRELAQLDPRDAEPPHMLALLEATQGRTAEAGEYFRQALALAPHDVDLRNDYGYWLYVNKRLDDAERELAFALQANPEHARVTNNLALVVGHRGRFQESLALFKRAGTEAEAYSNLAYVYAQLGQYDDARQQYQKALELEPHMNAAVEGLVQLDRRTADPAVQQAEAPGPR